MKKLVLTLIFLIAMHSVAQNVQSIDIHNQKLEKENRYTKGNLYQKDFLLFINMLRNTHPAFTKQITRPFNIDSLERKGYIELKNCKSNRAFEFFVQRQISMLHDGHTTINLNTPQQDELYYLYNLSYTKEGYLLRAVDKSYPEALGKLVVKINDKTTDKFIQLFSQYISSDNEVALRARILGTQQLNHFALVSGLPCARKDSLLILTLNDGSSIKLHPSKPDRTRMGVFKPHSETVNPINIREKSHMPFLYKIDEKHSIAYLQFNSCEDQYTQRWMVKERGIKLTEEQEKRLSAIPYFHETLQKMFTEVKKKGIETVVIDVRQNGGGNSILCTELMSWLYPIVKESKFNSQYKTISVGARFSPLFEQVYQKMAQEIEDQCKKANGGKIDYATLYDDTWKPLNLKNLSTLSQAKEIKDETLPLLNTNSDSIFQGKVVFIQDEQTFSSASILILEAHDNHIGRVIGGESEYNTSNFGDILMWRLPSTQIEGSVSFKMFLRPDLSCFNEKHLVPTPIIIPTIANFLSGDDPCWQWIIENYGKQ